MTVGLFSKIFGSGQNDGKVDGAIAESNKLIKDQAAQISALKTEIQTLKAQKIQVIYQVWKPGPTSRPFNLSGTGLPCRWVLPCLKEIPPELMREFDVPSFDFESSEVYKVNLGAQSCTCPDFDKRRKELPLGHALRCCKHIVKILQDTGLLECQEDFTRWVLTEANKHADRIFLEMEFTHGKVFFGVSPGQEWVDMLAPKKTSKGPGEYTTFGFNVAEKRWSYGTTPFKPVPIKEAIHILLGGRSYA